MLYNSLMSPYNNGYNGTNYHANVFVVRGSDYPGCLDNWNVNNTYAVRPSNFS